MPRHEPVPYHPDADAERGALADFPVWPEGLRRELRDAESASALSSCRRRREARKVQSCAEDARLRVITLHDHPMVKDRQAWLST